MNRNAISTAVLTVALASTAAAQVGRQTFSFDVEAANTTTGNLGVAYLNGEIFVTSRGNGPTTSPPHTVWVYDTNGTLLRQFSQSANTTSSSWGWRDGATDDVSLIFGSEAGIEVIDPNGNPVNQLIAAGGAQSITQPIISTGTTSTHRAIAFDPFGNGGSGSLFVGNFGSDIEEIALDGTLLHTYSNNDSWSAYGLAFDISSGTLWMNSVPNAGQLKQYTIDRSASTLTPTGVTIDRAFPSSAQGGLDIVRGGLDGRDCGFDLLGLDQATSDTITGYRVDLWDTLPFTGERELVAGYDGANFSPDGVTVPQSANTVDLDLAGAAGTSLFVFADVLGQAPRAAGPVGPFKSPWELTFPRANSIYLGGFTSGTPLSLPAAQFTAAPSGTTITWQALYLDPNLPTGGPCGLRLPLISTNLTTHQN